MNRFWTGEAIYELSVYMVYLQRYRYPDNDSRDWVFRFHDHYPLSTSAQSLDDFAHSHKHADFLPSVNHQGNRVQPQTTNDSQLSQEPTNNPSNTHVRPLRVLPRVQRSSLPSRHRRLLRRRSDIRLPRRTSLRRRGRRPRRRTIRSARRTAGIPTPALPTFDIQSANPRAVVLAVDGYDACARVSYPTSTRGEALTTTVGFGDGCTGGVAQGGEPAEF